MPIFPKKGSNTAGMKGSEFYGYGNSSPLARVTDKDVVDAQKELDKTELKFRPPNWAKAAGALAGVAQKKIDSLMAEDDDSENNESDDASAVGSVQKKAKSNELVINEPKLERGTVEGLNYIPPS
tara:strand:- start:708 stop:1082 length:375 start_codon:yes stop_codon:yes gene_type:complete